MLPREVVGNTTGSRGTVGKFGGNLAAIPADVVVKLTAAINRAIMVKGVTQLGLAASIGYDTKTIRKMINGQSVHPQTLIDTCQFLDIEYESFFEQKAEARIAEEEYGAYHFQTVREYIGDYYFYRRSFDRHTSCVCTLMSIFWSDVANALAFQHKNKFVGATGTPVDHSQAGLVHMSPMIGLVHLVTVARGAVRLVTLHRMRFPDTRMYGVVLTQSDEKLYWKPAVSAVVVERIGSGDAPDETALGLVTATDPRYAGIAAHLRAAEDQFVNFAVRPAAG